MVAFDMLLTVLFRLADIPSNDEEYRQTDRQQKARDAQDRCQIADLVAEEEEVVVTRADRLDFLVGGLCLRFGLLLRLAVIIRGHLNVVGNIDL